jgi:hypothetical protein
MNMKIKLKNKGIVVPYIIALILGIAVIGLLGYWFFVLGGRFGGEAHVTDCDAMMTSYCQEWKNACYNIENKPIQPNWEAGGCTPPGDDASECKAVVGEADAPWCVAS